MNLTPEEREFYEDHLKWLRIEANTLKKAEERGEARGKAEEKIAIAKLMLKKNKPLEEILEFTGLTRREIEKLINDIITSKLERIIWILKNTYEKYDKTKVNIPTTCYDTDSSNDSKRNAWFT